VLADHGVEEKQIYGYSPAFFITSVLVEGLVSSVDPSFIN